jgi:hypothetical protein
MFPRKPLALWQVFARPSRVASFGFVNRSGLRNDDRVSRGPIGADVRALDCYPFPSLRSGPERVGPAFSDAERRPSADREKSRKIGFELTLKSGQTGHRTKNQRGSSPCVNRLSFLHSSQFRLPAACSPTRPLPARALVLFPARPLARSPITKPQNLPWSVAPSASWLATPACAADLAQPSDFTTAASRGYSSAGRSHLRARADGPVPAPEGREPCSRKS